MTVGLLETTSEVEDLEVITESAACLSDAVLRLCSGRGEEL
jgi:hypothetical protein